MANKGRLGGATSPTKTANAPHGHVTVTSGVFEIPLDEDGNLSLYNIRAQLPGASGLWFMSEDGQRKRAVSYDKKKNKLTPPEGNWTDRTYSVSYSAAPEFFGEKELERFEIASRLFQQSLESASRLAKLEIDEEESIKQKVLVKESKEPSLGKKQENIGPIYDYEKTSKADGSVPRKLSLSDGRFSEKKDETHEFCKNALSEAKEAGRQLEAELAIKNARILELEKKCNVQETSYKEKCNDVEDLKKSLEKKSKEFDLVAVPIEGFGDSHVLQEINSLRRQLDDSKWRCGELEAALSSKTREASALHDWKREAENTINLLQAEHGSCQIRREKLEATVHALHQFALIMKKEAELAKHRAGIEPQFKLYNAEDVKYISEQAEEKVRRLEKDLDVTRDNLYRQAEEVENYKWRCREFEETLMARDKELKATIKEAFNKEKMLKSEIDSLLKIIPDQGAADNGQFKRVSDHHRERLTKMASPYDATDSRAIAPKSDDKSRDLVSNNKFGNQDEQQRKACGTSDPPPTQPLKSALRRSSSVKSEVDLASSGVPSTPTSMDDLSLIKDVDALMAARTSKDRETFGPSSLSTASFTRQLSDGGSEVSREKSSPPLSETKETPASTSADKDDDESIRIDFK